MKYRKGEINNIFRQQLMRWHRHENKRKMPWKSIKDPYKIWLSEIILQQTRVEQGTAYYEKIVGQFPTIQELALAEDETVYKLWEGLGYYSRCRNLLETARFLTNEKSGIFPNSYNELLALKGVGAYTAAAIASFAYQKPHAVIDGNVIRVLARFFGIKTAVKNAQEKKMISVLAHELLDHDNPAFYNQAIMDFGATVCKPQLPLCNSCPLHEHCFALHNKMVDVLPLKKEKIVLKNRWFTYIIFHYEDNILIRKRNENDIWQNLYEFYLIETDKKVPVLQLLTQKEIQKLPINNSLSEFSDKIYIQKLSHRQIHGNFVQLYLDKPHHFSGYEWVHFTQLDKLAFPKLISQYFDRLKQV